MRADDNDRGKNGQVKYSIEAPSPSLSQAPFEIKDSTKGEIFIKTQIDREAYDKDFIQVKHFCLLKLYFFPRRNIRFTTATRHI